VDAEGFDLLHPAELSAITLNSSTRLPQEKTLGLLDFTRLIRSPSHCGRTIREP
jgi:hypothetical protein